MKEIGRVIHISPCGKAVVKAQKTPKIGEIVFDEKKKPIGRIFDVFGPIISPYVEVDVKNPQEVVNSVLYVNPSPKRELNKKRRK
ncbi:MAG: Gar1/Naf1 family protein [Candidatus Bathyarchaeia archaeon]